MCARVTSSALKSINPARLQDALDEPGGHAYVALLFKLGRGAEAVELLTSITRGDEEADEPQGWAHAVSVGTLYRRHA